jgi:hypothetical protein
VKLRPPPAPSAAGRRAEFCSDLDARLVDEHAGTDRLLAPLIYYSALLGCNVVAPAGFVTDYASVPRLVGMYLLFGGKGKRAAVIHDLLYSGYLVRGRALTREEAEAVFREALEATGYSAFTVSCMYTGVRIGGAGRFNAPNLPQDRHVAIAMTAGALEAP